MKPYFLVAHNFFKLRISALKKGAVLNAKRIEMFSRKTKFVFKKNSKVTIGCNVVSDGRCVIMTDSNADLIIGDNVYFNENAMLSCKGKITIGDRCKFGPNVNVFDNNHRFDAQTGVSEEHRIGEVHIGSGCWLGANVVILKGAKIGKNCLIGAGCIISEDIPDSSIVKQGRDLQINPLGRKTL